MEEDVIRWLASTRFPCRGRIRRVYPARRRPARVWSSDGRRGRRGRRLCEERTDFVVKDEDGRVSKCTTARPRPR